VHELKRRTVGEVGYAVGGGEEAPAVPHGLVAVGGDVLAETRGIGRQAVLVKGVQRRCSIRQPGLARYVWMARPPFCERTTPARTK
jgi:hypothetical protein